MKQFTTAARRGVSALPDAEKLEFEYEVREGEFVTMHANPPTTGQLALFVSDQATRGGMGAITAMLDLFAVVLDEPDFDIIKGQLQDGLDLEVITEIFTWLMEEWGLRPTPRSSGLSPSRRTNGQRSTAKRRAAVSTTSS